MKVMRMIANKKIYSVYQPIVRVSDDSVYGYEALVRSKNGMTPDVVFSHAAACGMVRDLDMLCIDSAVESPPDDNPVFVNVMPFTLIWLSINGGINELAKKIKSSAVLEITEVESVSDNLHDLLAATKEAKKHGFKIAIDDVSRGFGQLQIIPLLSPDYIKIDRALVANRSKRYNIVKKSIINIANEIGSTIIAEGVETEAEFKSMESLGADLFQGYYFAHPGEGYPKKIQESV